MVVAVTGIWSGGHHDHCPKSRATQGLIQPEKPESFRFAVSSLRHEIQQRSAAVRSPIFHSDEVPRLADLCFSQLQRFDCAILKRVCLHQPDIAWIAYLYGPGDGYTVSLCVSGTDLGEGAGPVDRKDARRDLGILGACSDAARLPSWS